MPQKTVPLNTLLSLLDLLIQATSPLLLHKLLEVFPGFGLSGSTPFERLPLFPPPLSSWSRLGRTGGPASSVRPALLLWLCCFYLYGYEPPIAIRCKGEVESFISGLSLAKRFNKRYGKDIKTNEIFELYRKNNLDVIKFIDEFKTNLAMSLSVIINILDPDAFIFGGGVSNEIDFLNEIHSRVSKYVTGNEYEGVFLKPKYGDASGVRGAARLGRSSGL